LPYNWIIFKWIFLPIIIYRGLSASSFVRIRIILPEIGCFCAAVSWENSFLVYKLEFKQKK